VPAAGYLTKPFEENDLRIAIEVGLYRAKLKKERETLIKELQEAVENQDADRPGSYLCPVQENSRRSGILADSETVHSGAF
jgi:DNA-binding response OmpR family regulator